MSNRKRLRLWSRVHGTVYNIRCEPHKPRWWRRHTNLGYVGMTVRKMEVRVTEHLYGDASRGITPKPWADLVPGYDPNAKTRRAQLRMIRQLIADGTVYASFQKPCFHGWLKLRESWRIATKRPLFNIQENLGNPRHIPKWQQEKDRARRDAGKSQWAANATGMRVLSGGRIEYYGAPLTGELHERMLRISTYTGQRRSA